MQDSISNSAGSQKASLVIPGYISIRAEGLFVNLIKMTAGENFAEFVNQLFSGDTRFAGLKYDTFVRLLYDDEWRIAAQSKTPEVKLASGIIEFPEQRRALYKSVKVLERGKLAEYVFEPVNADVISEEPSTLDFDEFVVAMWSKGVKYGIHEEEVRKSIAAHKAERKIVASQLDPTEGVDAGIEELSPDLHRDNTPKTLWNGKADLRAFKNRFPQITKGTRLLRKIKKIMGKHGFRVTGERIEPLAPKDLNFNVLTSQGTSVLYENNEEYIVADKDGFLTIDTDMNLISVAEKIETAAGISMKTTGDLQLDVEEFVEHGDVQEGRVVKGRNMIFKSNVFGSLVSSKGNITVEGNLTGGLAEAQDGNVSVGRASRAVLRAYKGEITARYCENCTIIGRKINLEHAVNCEIVGTEISIDAVEGCMVAGNVIKILNAGESKSRENQITMIIPNLTEFDQKIAALQEKVKTCAAGIESKKQEIDQIKSVDPEVAKFLALSEKIKGGEIKLSSEQAGNWQKLMTKNATPYNMVETFKKQITALERMRSEAEQEIHTVTQQRDAAGAGISCEIDNVTGLTMGQTMRSANGIQLFNDMSGNEIKSTLQKVDGLKAQIFSEDSDSISWQYK